MNHSFTKLINCRIWLVLSLSLSVCAWALLSSFHSGWTFMCTLLSVRGVLTSGCSLCLNRPIGYLWTRFGKSGKIGDLGRIGVQCRTRMRLITAIYPHNRACSSSVIMKLIFIGYRSSQVPALSKGRKGIVACGCKFCLTLRTLAACCVHAAFALRTVSLLPRRKLSAFSFVDIYFPPTKLIPLT